MKHLFLVCLFLATEATFAQLPDKPNILFILVDDLNDYSGLYDSHPQISTPAIDSLAAGGLTFLNGFANNPGCAPSRTSMLSGKSSLYTQVFVNTDYEDHFRENFTAEKNNEVVFTLPEVLKDSGGYFTYGINKVFHAPNLNDFDNDTEDPCAKAFSWNKMVNFLDPPELISMMEDNRFMDFFPFGSIPDDLETQMVDYLAADTAIAFLNEVADGSAEICDRPFFLAVGFKKPHSDRYIPEHYYPDFYQNQPESFNEPYMYNDPYNTVPYTGIVMPPQPPDGDYADYFAFPEDGVARVLAESGDYREPRQNFIDALAYYPVADEALSPAEELLITTKNLDAGYVMNYLAAVQFIDHQIGRVLEALQAHPELAENTIIVLVSDHGYALGEKNHYAKWALWECINRIPFIITGPGIPVARTNNTVTLLDLFPTLLELTGTNPPLNPDGSAYLDGYSIVPVIEHPEKTFNRPAVSVHKRGASVGSCYPHFSVRTDRYHLINYRWNNDGSHGTSVCDDSQIIYERELYDIGADREIDPEEWNNLADDPEYAGLIHYLTQFFPDSSLYNQPVYGVSIQSKPMPCFTGTTSHIKLQSRLTSPVGNILTGGGDKIYRWTHSLGNDTIIGSSLDFDLGSLPEWVVSSADHIFFYLEVLDAASGDLLAFDQLKVYMQSSSPGIADFHILNIDNTAYVTELSLDASVVSHIWDVDGQYSTATAIPAPYTPDSAGSHYISLQAKYGNGCTQTVTRRYATSDSDLRFLDPGLLLFPNPGTGVCWFESSQMTDEVRLLDMEGRTCNATWKEVADGLYELRADGLPPGLYSVVCTIGNEIRSAVWVISGR